MSGKTLTRADLAEAVVRKVGLPRNESQELVELVLNEISESLARGEQVILFLNRRGWSSSILCAVCGEVVRCNHCSIPLTLHKDIAKLVCHVCGFQRLPPRKCPANCRLPGRRGSRRAPHVWRPRRGRCR